MYVRVGVHGMAISSPHIQSAVSTTGQSLLMTGEMTNELLCSFVSTGKMIEALSLLCLSNP